MTITAYRGEQRLGVKAHFSLPHYLQETANQYGLSIQLLENGRYALHSADNNFDIHSFAPSSVQHDEGVFDLDNLNTFLSFLHQPIAHVSEDHEARTTLHRVLRFTTTGSVEIPPDTTEELEKETAECHAKTEQAMRDGDTWRKHLEIANFETVQSAIPQTSIDPTGGFHFNLSGQKHYDGLYQRELNEQFWTLVNEATDNRYADRPNTITLSGAELEKFVHITDQNLLHDLVDHVEFEEAVQEKLQGIRKRVIDLSRSTSFRRLAADTQQDRTAQLQELMHSTSALTPVVSSQVMRDLWTRYHFTERHRSPLEAVGKEYAVFMAVMDMYAQEGGTTPAQMEAIAEEFYSLVAFSEKIAGALKEAGSPNISKLQNTFAQASIAGASLSPEFLNGDHEEILSTLEKGLGQGGSAAGQLAEAGIDTTLDFTMDVINFIKESPKTAATFVALATTLYMMNGGDAEAAQAAQDTIMLFGEEGLEEAVFDFESLPEEAKQVQNWHWDMGPLGLYKHYMYDNAVVGPAQTMMDWVRMGIQSGYEQVGLPINPNTEFSKSAESVVEPLADQLFKVNLFQNFSHAAFWMYMTSKGFNHGFKGANRIFELLSPLTNLGYQTSIKSAEILRLRKSTDVSSRLMALVESENTDDFFRYEGDFQISPYLCAKTGKPCVLLGMAKAAQARVAVEDTLPETIREASLSLKIDGLKHQFQIGAANLQPTLNALAQFDLVLEHIAGQIGIDQPWYRNFLKERLDAVTEALRAFQHDGDEQILQNTLQDNMQDLIAAQIRYSETSPLYEALMGHEVDEKSNKQLNRTANIQFGKLKRASRIAENKSKDGLKAKADTLGTVLWGGIVGAARKVQGGIGAVAKKPAIIATAGISAACVALDMAGGGNDLTNMVSFGTGSVLSGATTTTTFLLYNFWEDVLGVHVGSGAGLLAVGAAAGYAYKRMVKPSTSLGLETVEAKTGFDLSGVWNRFKRKEKSEVVKGVATIEPSLIVDHVDTIRIEEGLSPVDTYSCPMREL